MSNSSLLVVVKLTLDGGPAAVHDPTMLVVLNKLDEVRPVHDEIRSDPRVQGDLVDPQ